MNIKLTVVVAAVLLQGCGVAPTGPDLCFANYDHISHPKRGEPFGPKTEEGTIDFVGGTCRWNRDRLFFEYGLSYAIPDSDLHGDDWLFNGRVAYKLWEKKQ